MKVLLNIKKFFPSAVCDLIDYVDSEMCVDYKFSEKSPYLKNELHEVDSSLDLRLETCEVVLSTFTPRCQVLGF